MKTPIPPGRAAFAQSMHTWADKERALLSDLAAIGVSEKDIDVLRSDERLLEILADESRRDSSAPADLERVMEWHEARLQRIANELHAKEHSHDTGARPTKPRDAAKKSKPQRNSQQRSRRAR